MVTMLISSEHNKTNGPFEGCEGQHTPKWLQGRGGEGGGGAVEGGPWWDDFDVLLQHPVGLRHGEASQTSKFCLRGTVS